MAFSVSYLIQARDEFSAVAKKITAKTKGITKSVKGLTRETERSRRKFRSFRLSLNKDTSSMASGFRRLGAAALAFFGLREFIDIGSTFQDSMADLSAITGAVGKDFDMLKEKTLQMSKAAAIGQADVATSIKLVASAKPELLKNLPLLLQTTEQVLLLKNAAGIELSEAALITSRSLNIFGKGAEEAGKFVNILAAGAQLGSSEIGDTGRALLIAGGLAKASGLTFIKTNAALQAIAKGGFVGEKAGTGLQGILQRLLAEGVNVKKLGLEKVFTTIGKAIEKQTDAAKKGALIQRFFGQEHAKIGFALIENIGLYSSLDKELVGTNAAQEQAAIRMATFSTKMRLLGVTIKEKVIQVFERLAPTLKSIAGDFVVFIDSITPKQVQDFADGLKTLIVNAVQAAKDITNELIPAFKEFFVRLDRTALKGFTEDMVTLAGAIGSIADGIRNIKQFGSFVGQGLAMGQLAVEGARKPPIPGVERGTPFAYKFPQLFPDFNDERTPAASSVTPIFAPMAFPANQQQSASIDLNITAPEGVVESVQTTQTGEGEKMNLGVNMVESR